MLKSTENVISKGLGQVDNDNIFPQKILGKGL